MHSIVAALTLMVAATWAADTIELPEHIKTIIETPGQQYDLYDKYTDKVSLPKKAAKDLYKGLNIDRTDNEVGEKDLQLHYWDDDVKFAVKRFNQIIDDENDGNLDIEELKNDLEKKHIAVALSECEFIKSPGLRQSCYADQLLTYVLLCVNTKDIEEFYAFLDKDGNGITKEEVEGLEHENNHDKQTTAEELGAYSGTEGVSKEELEEYMRQESINDDVRRCREKVEEDGSVDFKDECLFEELIEYINEDLTDLDIAVVFRALDVDDNGRITEAELENVLPESYDNINTKDVMSVLDMNGVDVMDIDFEEFRAYLRSPTVLIQLEDKCTEKLHTQKEEIECIYNTYIELIKDLHEPIWLVVPDLEQVIAFESYDKDNDGLVEDEDLKQFELFKDEQTLKRFKDETDKDLSHHICLEEFNEYVDVPHMIYGTADCLLTPRSDAENREKCYNEEIGEVVENFKFFEDEAFDDWFNYYDSDKSGLIDESSADNLKEKVGEDLVDDFLEELAQGGKIVTPFEFKWYVKQQELAEEYEDVLKEETKDISDEDTETLNEKLKTYISDELTENDIEEFFKKLDRDHNEELTIDDFEDAQLKEKFRKLLEVIDSSEPEGDEDETVNFREFWLWLNSDDPEDDGDKKIKDLFEEKCTKKFDNQKDELKCYVKKFYGLTKDKKGTEEAKPEAEPAKKDAET